MNEIIGVYILMGKPFAIIYASTYRMDLKFT